MKKQIATATAPAAIGPYSQAIEAGELLFCSGQIALDHRSGHLIEGGIEAETRYVMGNLTEILRAAGLDLNDIVKTTIFMIDLGEFDIVNRIYDEHFEAPYPARSTVQVAALPRGARVEIEAIARRRS
jgi:2-iminobutanoate/2-iminopropanoate deaminase